MPKLSEIVFGKKEKIKKTPLLSKSQQDLLRYLRQAIQEEGPLKDLFSFNKESFEKGVSEPAMQNFRDNILPVLLEKFNAGGQYGGSGMFNAGFKEAENLQSELAKLMYQGQQQSQQNKQAGLNTLLNVKEFEPYMKARMPGVLPKLIGSFAEGGGEALGRSLGNMGSASVSGASGAVAG